MDPVRSPYTPNAGARPPALEGRDNLLDDFRLLVQRVVAGRTDQGCLVTGLRGVGMTVLLGEFHATAVDLGAVAIDCEVPKLGGGLTERFAAWRARRYSRCRHRPAGPSGPGGPRR